MTDLIEQVARALYDEMEGPVNNQDFARQTRQWDVAQRLSSAAIAIIVERCAPVLREMEATFADPDRLKNSESAMYSFASAITTLRTLAGGENNGGV